MARHFPSEDSCFINKNYRLLEKYSHGRNLMNREETLKMLEEVHFGPLAKFNRLNKKTGGQPPTESLEEIQPEMRAIA
jgi:hypothetical protein